MMVFAGALTTKQQLMHPHCFLCYDKTWMKTVLTALQTIIAEQPSLTQYERPICYTLSYTFYPKILNKPCSLIYKSPYIIYNYEH